MSRSPLVHPLLQNVLHSNYLNEVTQSGARPCNILFPSIFADTIAKYKFLLQDHNIHHTIYYAHKANKEDVFLETARNA
jgi:diaminopimelate decarboxylase